MFQHLFSRGGLSLERLHVLLELQEAGSLSKAAHGDPVKQSQYSRQLKDLSNYCEVALTVRQGRELKLTEAGNRLALIARESFTGLDSFQRDCSNQPLSVVLGAGDSLLHWFVLPRLGAIQKRLGNVHLTLQNLRNTTMAERLMDLTLDFGLIREGAILPRLQKERLLQLGYSIFVHRSLVSDQDRVNHRFVLENLPLIRHNPTGELSHRISMLAEKEGVTLNYRATCESFPQASCAIKSGHYAAVLPTLAASELAGGDVMQVEWPALRTEARWVALAWNKKMVTLRPGLDKVKAALSVVLNPSRLAGSETKRSPANS